MPFVLLWLSWPASGSIGLFATLKCQLQKPESRPHRTGRRCFQGAVVCSWAALGCTKEVANLPEHLFLLHLFSSTGVRRWVAWLPFFVACLLDK